MSEALVVCQRPSDVPEETSGEVVVIDSVVRQFDSESVNGLFDRLVRLDVEHPHDVPVYTLISNHVWGDGELHEQSPRSMEVLVPLYRHLEDRVTAETTVVRSYGVSARYLDVVRDLVANEGLRLESRAATDEGVSDRRIVVGAVLWLVASVFDGVLSLLLRPWFAPSGADLLVKYPAFRSGSFGPVERRLDRSYDATFTLLTISYFSHVRETVAKETNVVPIRCFDTVRGMLSEYAFFLRFGYDLLVTDRTAAAVTDAIERETGVRLERTVGTLFRRAAWSNVQVYLYHGAAERILDRGSYETLLLTSSGPSGRAIAFSRTGNQTDVYVLPHSIQHQRLMTNCGQYAGVFVEGTIVEQAVRESKTDLVPAGYPKHVEIYERRSGDHDDDHSECGERLLVGTQPFDDGLRREFVLDIVPTVLERTDWEAVIKLHPAEESPFYEQVLADAGIDADAESRLEIVDDDLYDRIEDSDLLVTVHSNVGLEAVILNTPAACYNVWSPDVRDPLYAKHGPVPALRGRDELVAVLSEDIDDHRRRQQSLLDGPYNVVGNSVEQIPSVIETRLIDGDDGR